LKFVFPAFGRKKVRIDIEIEDALSREESAQTHIPISLGSKTLAEPTAMQSTADAVGGGIDFQIYEETKEVPITSQEFLQKLEKQGRAVILTTMGQECDAACDHIDQISYADSQIGRRFIKGTFQANDKIWTIQIADVGQGSENASAEAMAAIDSFRPQIILLLGTAGSVKDKDVTLGDVVVGDKVYKVSESKHSRPESKESDLRLISVAKICRKNNWKKRIKGGVQGQSNVVIGPIATIDHVMKSRSDPLYSIVSNRYLVVEMEGFGFLTAANIQERPAAVIRGVADLIEGKDEADLAGWQTNAMANASAFAFELIANVTDRDS
jgi:nucleoside phosphorylase